MVVYVVYSLAINLQQCVHHSEAFKIQEEGEKNHLNIAQNQRLITVREIAGILKWDYVFVLISD